jgi:rubrerythrin
MILAASYFTRTGSTTHIHTNTMEENAMKGLWPAVRFSVVVAVIASQVISFSGCSKKEEPKGEAKVAQKLDGQTPATIENLKLAYTSEVKHASWYEAFAKQAQKENLGEIAVMFRAIAQSEKVHADNMAAALKAKGAEMPASTVENPPAGKTKQYLKLASSSEGVETESMYPAFAQKAEIEADSATAQMFRQTMEADARHGRLLKRAMEQETNISRLPYMMCPKCGYIIGSEKDEECRVCKAKKETFKKI